MQQDDLKEEEKGQKQLQKRQRREEALFLSAMQNLIALCHISRGTAREVLRRLTSGTTAGGSSTKSGGSGNNAKGRFGGGNKTNDGTSWMIQLFQQRHEGASSSYKPQVECLRLVCVLLETNDYSILSKMAEVSARLQKQGGKNSKGSGGNVGLAYVALRYGIQRLLELVKRNEKRRENEDCGDIQEQIDAYSQYTTRLLRDIRDTMLPSASPVGENADEGDGAIGSRKGFVLGIGATVSTRLVHRHANPSHFLTVSISILYS